MNRRGFVAASISSATLPLLARSEAAKASQEASPLSRISVYVPDPRATNERFRFWQVSQLINQAADLADQCLAATHEYVALQATASQADLDFGIEEHDLTLLEDRVSKEAFRRELKVAQRMRAFYDQSGALFDASIRHAQQVYDRGGGSTFESLSAHVRDGMVLNDKGVARQDRAAQIDVANSRVIWTGEDAAYEEAKAKARRTFLEHRRALRTDGQPLALQWRAHLASERAALSYQQCLDRAVAAERGMRRIFGFIGEGVQPPASSHPEVAINYVCLWVRKAVEYLVAYEQLDQSFVVSIPMRGYTERGVWSDLQRATSDFAASVMLPRSLFQRYDNVRLRGMGASLIGDCGEVPWTITASIPVDGVFIRRGSELPAQVETDAFPECVLGRVENRRAPRPVELFGLTSLANASPIGRLSTHTWMFRIQKPRSDRESFRKLDDIVIELSCMGRPLGRRA